MPKVTINEYENKYNKDILIFKDLNELDLSTSIKYEDLWSWVDYEVNTLEGKVKHILIHVKDGEVYIGEVDDDKYNFLLKENKTIYYNVIPTLKHGVDAVAFIEDYLARIDNIEYLKETLKLGD